MIHDVIEELKKIKARGFIPSRRDRSTGVGYTLECELGIEENNLSDPDIDGTVELKAKRAGSSSRITGFCLEPIKVMGDRKLIEKYGYQPEDPTRFDAYYDLKVDQRCAHGFILRLEKLKYANKTRTCLVIRDVSDKRIAHWPLSVLEFKFQTKYSNLLLVTAERKREKGIEYFHYNDAVLCTDITEEKIAELFQKGDLIIGTRMWMNKHTGKVRNHGTCVRGSKESTLSLFANVKKVL